MPPTNDRIIKLQKKSRIRYHASDPKPLPTPKPEIMIGRPVPKTDIHIPKPVERSITRVPELEDDKSEKIYRHPGIYTNIPSPYGLATEMLQDQLREERERKTG